MFLANVWDPHDPFELKSEWQIRRRCRGVFPQVRESLQDWYYRVRRPVAGEGWTREEASATGQREWDVDASDLRLLVTVLTLSGGQDSKPLPAILAPEFVDTRVEALEECIRGALAGDRQLDALLRCLQALNSVAHAFDIARTGMPL